MATAAQRFGTNKGFRRRVKNPSNQRVMRSNMAHQAAQQRLEVRRERQHAGSARR